VSGYTDVGSWFEVINPNLRCYGLQGPCMSVDYNGYIGHPWDRLLIEFGSGVKRWIRRENLTCTDRRYA